jgi:hypothetical protein
MAFPYLIKVSRYFGEKGDVPYLAEVVVVQDKNRWRRYLVNGSVKSSSDYEEDERWRFNTEETAVDALTGLGRSVVSVDFKDGASEEQIEKALQQLQDSRPELKKPNK